MKTKNIFLTGIAVVLFLTVFTSGAFAQHALLLPHNSYDAEKDHYSGPACVQMILRNCPGVTDSSLPLQDDIYNVIRLHNSEGTTWYSDPNGIKGALRKSSGLPACGSWIDSSHTNKSAVLGHTLYYINDNKYITPVWVAGNAATPGHWVIVFGFQTDVEPTTYNNTVTLDFIMIDDPMPGSAYDGMVAGNVWLNNTALWGAPLNKPGSNWYNKYIAINEPPPVAIAVNFREWVLQGEIIPLTHIKESYRRWLDDIKRNDLARGPFEILNQPPEIEKPILIDAGNYSYYLVPFKNQRLAAIFNAYTGEFEEFRYVKQPQAYIADSQTVLKTLQTVLETYKLREINLAKPRIGYNPDFARLDRFSPVWTVKTTVTDASGKEKELDIFLDSAAQVLTNLKNFFPGKDGDDADTTGEKPRPFLSLHVGSAVPVGTLGDFYNAGPNVVVDFEYPFSRSLSLRAAAGYNGFKSKLPLSYDDTSVINVNLNMRISAHRGAVTFFAEAGPGYYLLEDSPDKMGADVGCGIHYNVSRQFGIEFAAHYHSIFTDPEKTDFIHLAGGVTFGF